eukprot:scaffold12121_cov141-Isochrysis_galbana.AAC.2
MLHTTRPRTTTTTTTADRHNDTQHSALSTQSCTRLTHPASGGQIASSRGKRSAAAETAAQPPPCGEQHWQSRPSQRRGPP